MRDFLDPLTHDPRWRDGAVSAPRRRLAVRLSMLGGLLSLALVMLACGSSGSIVGTSPAPTATPTAAFRASAATTASNMSIDVTGGGLHIQSADGALGCAYSIPHTSSPSNVQLVHDGWVALTASRLTYDAGELQQMRDYLNAWLNGGQGILPDTLQRLQGAPTTPQIEPFAGGGIYGFYNPTYCDTVVNLTNTTNAPIQILQAGLRLQAAPQPNPIQYRLVDLCASDLIGAGVCQGHNDRNRSISCVAYGAQIQITGSTLGAEDLASPVGLDPYGNPCPALVLSPGATVHLSLNFASADPLVYRGAIEFKVVTAAGPQTLILSQASTTLTFADPSQLACYRLQGSAFVLEAQGAAALQGPILDLQTHLYEDCF